MKMLGTLEEGRRALPSPVHRLARWLESAAGVALVIMMMITVVDVLLRNVYNKPIAGAIELVKIMMAYLVFLAVPETFLSRKHIQVDVVDHLVGRRSLLWLEILGELCGLVLLAVMLVVMWGEAMDAHEMGDVTSDLMVPLTVLWAPMLVGAACSLAAVIALIVADLRQLSHAGRAQ
jgi:TRAP-type transport system small permease protein